MDFVTKSCLKVTMRCTIAKIEIIQDLHLLSIFAVSIRLFVKVDS